MEDLLMQDGVMLGSESYLLTSSQNLADDERPYYMPADLYLTSASVVKPLASIAAALIGLYILIGIGDLLTGYHSLLFSRLNKVFSLDLELNVPSYFETLLLLISSVLLAFISYFRRRQGAPFVHWGLLSAGFFYMSFDEIASVHERIVEPMRSLLGGHDLGVFYFAWVVPGIVLVMALGGAFLRFWWNLPAKTRLLTFVSATLYLSGALVMEMIDGDYAEIHGTQGLTYMWMTCIEESLEMAGVILLIKTLIDYIGANLPRIDVYVGDKN